MNQGALLKDPAAGIPTQLLAHLHLLSRHRYPTSNNPSRETIVQYLLEAPKVIRELAAVGWQFLDGPPDGTIVLAWQPLEYLGTSFASDGYIYADAEQYFKSEIRGFTLEMFHQRCGYRPMAEAVATHSRRRYRLLPGSQPMGLPNPDPSLWIIHYSKAGARDQIPAASIPIMPIIHAQLQQRQLIKTQGQLPRKDFMLHDRANWPTIGLPPAVARASMPNQAAATAAHKRMSSVGMPEIGVEEEEDVSRGDILDFMTPRDISRMRYEQHHEWLEEVLESPYATLKIVPPELGLGRKGELEELTRDFFDAPITALHEVSANAPPPRVGRMLPGKAEEFTKRAHQKIRDMQGEIERLKQKHSQRMTGMRRIAHLNEAEKKLRVAPTTSERKRSMGEHTGQDQNKGDAADQIVREVEGSIGKQIELGSNVQIIAKGGLDDRRSSSARPPERSASPVKPVPEQDTSVHDMPAQPQGQPLEQSNSENVDQLQQLSEEEAEDQNDELEEAVLDGMQDNPDDDEIFGNDDGMDGEDLGTLQDSADPLFDDLVMGDDNDMNVDVDMDMGTFGDEVPDDDQGGDAGQEWVMVDEQTDPQQPELQSPQERTQDETDNETEPPLQPPSETETKSGGLEPVQSQPVQIQQDKPLPTKLQKESPSSSTNPILPNEPQIPLSSPQPSAPPTSITDQPPQSALPTIPQPQPQNQGQPPLPTENLDTDIPEPEFHIDNDDFDDVDTAGDALANYTGASLEDSHGDGNDNNENPDDDDLGLGDIDDSAFGEAFRSHEDDEGIGGLD